MIGGFWYSVIFPGVKCMYVYLSLQSLVELLLVLGRDVLGTQLRQAIPDPAMTRSINIFFCSGNRKGFNYLDADMIAE